MRPQLHSSPVNIQYERPKLAECRLMHRGSAHLDSHRRCEAHSGGARHSRVRSIVLRQGAYRRLGCRQSSSGWLINCQRFRYSCRMAVSEREQQVTRSLKPIQRSIPLGAAVRGYGPRESPAVFRRTHTNFAAKVVPHCCRRPETRARGDMVNRKRCAFQQVAGAIDAHACHPIRWRHSCRCLEPAQECALAHHRQSCQFRDPQRFIQPSPHVVQ